MSDGTLNLDEHRLMPWVLREAEMVADEYQARLRVEDFRNRVFEAQVWFEEAYDSLEHLAVFARAEEHLTLVRRSLRSLR